jgi:phage terminase Nu1 subunit (DNA packaging protein)
MSGENLDAPRFLKKVEFARLKGWKPSYVTKLKDKGLLVLTDRGLVDVEATDARIAAAKDPSKQGVAERWQDHRQQRDVRSELDPHTASDAGDPDEPKDPGKREDYWFWRGLREKELALAAQKERLKIEGELVEAAAVREAQVALARAIRDRLLALPERVHLQLAAESDPLKVLYKLDAEVRDCLRQLAAQLGPGQTIQ